MAKSIAIFCDGTWNQLKTPHPTNVVLLSQMISATARDGTAQLVWYGEGVGTGQPVLGKVEQMMGGAFGVGLMGNVEMAYRFLVLNYEPGDRIYLFGFSRGAFTARTLGGLIRNCGILERSFLTRVPEAVALYRSRDPEDHPDAASACEFRARYASQTHVSPEDKAWRQSHRNDLADAPRLEITYMGLWDTVGALGVPNHIPVLSRWFNKRHRFHDAKLSGMVQAARHAQAIDETRRIFVDSPFDEDKLTWLNGDQTGDDAPYRQIWFPGDHGSIGGGGDITHLSNNALQWIAKGAMASGLSMDEDRLDDLLSDPKGSLRNNSKPEGLLDKVTRRARQGPSRVRDISRSACVRWHTDAEELHEAKAYRPETLKKVSQDLDQRDPDQCGAGTGGS